MILDVGPYRAPRFPAVNVSTMTIVDGELIVVYSKDELIYLARKPVDSDWLSAIHLTWGTAPTIHYDNPYLIVYFENGGKIQTLEILYSELGTGKTPLQNWDAIDTEFESIAVQNAPIKTVDDGIQHILAFDDWPDRQPIPTNLKAEGYTLYWDHTIDFTSTTKKYRLYENNILIEETTNNTFDYEIKSNTYYSVTSVYYHIYFFEEYESWKATIFIKDMVVLDDSLGTEFGSVDGTEITFTNYLPEREDRDDSFNFSQTSSISDINLIFYNFEEIIQADSETFSFGQTASISDINLVFTNYDPITQQ